MRSGSNLIARLSSAFLALFLAVVVWVVATYEKEPPRTDFLPSPVPLQVLDLGSQLVISDTLPTGVKIKVRALATTWEQLRVEDFQATLDLLNLQAGQHDLPVTVTTLLKRVAILGVEPARVTVNLQEVAERKLRVRVKILDQESIPLGYVSRLPVVEPEQITISGPKTAVNQVAEAVMEVSLRNARDTVVRQEAPVLLDAAGNRVQGLTQSPTTVSVRIVVERQLGYRDVTVRALSKGTPAAGYWISNISVEPALVTVYGQPAVIEQLPGFLDTEAIDLQDARNDVIKRVTLDLPEGVLVLGDGSGTEGILVRISVQPLLGGQTIRKTLELQRTGFGLKAAASPNVVDLILSGPIPALQGLKPEDVRVVLDLFGLGRGSHKINPTVILPEGLGLEMKSMVPDIVEVVIE